MERERDKRGEMERERERGRDILLTVDHWGVIKLPLAWTVIPVKSTCPMYVRFRKTTSAKGALEE